MSLHVDAGFWRERRVLITGHTGFKGGWLVLWLQALGAHVQGLSDGYLPEPSLFSAAAVSEAVAEQRTVDVRDYSAVAAAVGALEPEIVFHLAAQPLVGPSYTDPRRTFDTNVMGTVNVLEAIRQNVGTRVAVIVTSDKCYENQGLARGYREDDPLGGHDPYSSSKAAAEILTAAYRRSFFGEATGQRIASARAGNVIGGGDWAAGRLIPDTVRAVEHERPLRIRNPNATRPWQHVINPLAGYLLLAETLWRSAAAARAWNFGPPADDAHPVGWLVEQIRSRWDGRPQWEPEPTPQPHEAQHLQLDSARARTELGWHPLVPLDTALDSIIEWYGTFLRGGDVAALTRRQISTLTAGASLA